MRYVIAILLFITISVTILTPTPSISDECSSMQQCDVGQGLTMGECELCTRGSKSVEQKFCEYCTPGYYQDKDGEAECTKCPKGSFAPYDASTGCYKCAGAGCMSATTSNDGAQSLAECHCPSGSKLTWDINYNFLSNNKNVGLDASAESYSQCLESDGTNCPTGYTPCETCDGSIEEHLINAWTVSDVSVGDEAEIESNVQRILNFHSSCQSSISQEWNEEKLGLWNIVPINQNNPNTIESCKLRATTLNLVKVWHCELNSELTEAVEGESINLSCQYKEETPIQITFKINGMTRFYQHGANEELTFDFDKKTDGFWAVPLIQTIDVDPETLTLWGCEHAQFFIIKSGENNIAMVTLLHPINYSAFSEATIRKEPAPLGVYPSSAPETDQTEEIVKTIQKNSLDKSFSRTSLHNIARGLCWGQTTARCFNLACGITKITDYCAKLDLNMLTDGKLSETNEKANELECRLKCCNGNQATSTLSGCQDSNGVDVEPTHCLTPIATECKTVGAGETAGGDCAANCCESGSLKKDPLMTLPCITKDVDDYLNYMTDEQCPAAEE